MPLYYKLVIKRLEASDWLLNDWAIKNGIYSGKLMFTRVRVPS